MKYKSINELKRAFRKVAKDLIKEKDMRDFAHIQVASRKRGFANGRSPSGEMWEKLKNSTIERKRRKGSPNPEQILVDEGKMVKTAPVRSTKNTAIIPMAKSRIQVSRYHTKGTNHMPAREHWGFYHDAIKKINKLFVKRIWTRFMDMKNG
jgi:phage gpG-like protein